MNELTKLDQFLNEVANDFIGFDQTFRNLDRNKLSSKQTSFPPVNIVENGENVRIEMAIAGYSEKDIDIEYHDGILTIKGTKGEDETDENDRYVHRGIAKRAFERSFTIADTVVVDRASFDNGILTIHMYNELPEHRKHRHIEISNKSNDKKMLNE